MGTSIEKQLLKTLERIDRPGMFCARGVLPMVLPGLEVAGVGEVALPLEKRHATAIKKQAHQAPYGKGTQTLVDTSVRRVWEIDAEQVVLANPQWEDVLKEAVAKSQSELGLENQKLKAHLYKLLLYEKGSFFLPHRDGEKLDRMVATLVIALPSAHEGGELIVRHEGREEITDFSPHSRFQMQFAAFYADCEHEIRPVTKGYRLALAYNLTLEKSKRAITAPTSGEHIAEAARILRQWSSKRGTASQSNAASPLKLAVLLDHKYTESGLTFDALKGLDRARVDVLFTAARESGCDASLALVTYWESGSAEPTGDYGYGWHRDYWDEDDDDSDEADEDDGSEYLMGEVFDGSLSAEHFSDAEGNPLSYGEIPLDDEEIVSREPITERKPDKEDFEGYTGNAGMTLERWYHCAAVLLWPEQSRFDVLCEAGEEAAVGGLEQMVKNWKRAKKSEQDNLKKPCLEFASRIIANWPERTFSYSSSSASGWREEDEEDFDEDEFFDEDDEDFDDEDRSHRGQIKTPSRPLLSLLGELGDVSLISDWIRKVLARDVSIEPGKTLGDLCKKHGWATFRNELLKLFKNPPNAALERNARLLADWSLRKDKDADRKKLCSELAERIMSSVEHWEQNKPEQGWQTKTIHPHGLFPPLLQAFLALEETKRLDRLVTYILDRPQEFDLTTVQIPILLDLPPWLKRHVKHSSPPLQRWLEAVLQELEDRAAHPPQEPKDWQRESATDCKCADCKELSRFLKDPNTQTLRLPLATSRRQHLHQVIDRKKLDTTHVTERRGRPYTLVLTKTKGSYERALKAYRVDLDHLAKVGTLRDWHDKLKAGSAPPKTPRKTRSKRETHE